MKKNSYRKKRQQGFSLVYVISVGTIASLMAFAIMSPMLPVYRHVAKQDHDSRVSSIVETSMQYAIAKLNNAADNGSLNTITSPILVPPGLIEGAVVEVTMQKLPSNDPDLVVSPIYNSLNEWKDLPVGDAPQLDYRMLQVNFERNGSKSSLKVILGPNYIDTNNPNSAFFQNALFAQSTLNLGNDISVNSNSFDRTNPLIATKGTFIADSSNINGSVSADTLNISRNTKIAGDLNYNGNGPTNTDNFKTDDPSDTKNGAANVFGDGKKGINPAAPLPNDKPYGGVELNPAPSTLAPAPTKTASQPASIQENQTNVFEVTPAPSATDTQSLGAISLGADPENPSQTLIIPPGNYTIQSLDISAQSKIEIPSNGQVNLYIQGTTSGDTAFNINGDGIINNGPASNLQIFYNGSKNITWSSKSFNALLYAPNSNVSLNINQSGNFSGAISGDKVSISGKGSFNYNPTATSINAGGGGPGYKTPDKNSAPNQFNVLSWLSNNN